MEKCAACCQAACPGSPFFCSQGLRSGMTGSVALEAAALGAAASAGWSTPTAAMASIEIATRASSQSRPEDRAHHFSVGYFGIMRSVRLPRRSIGLKHPRREWAIIPRRGVLMMRTAGLALSPILMALALGAAALPPAHAAQAQVGPGYDIEMS